MDAASPPADPLERLLERIEADHAAARRSGKVTVGVLAFLVLFVIGYMSWIYTALGEFDAAQVTTIAAGKVDERLPEWQAEATRYVIDRAPEAAAKAKEALLRAPAALRRNLEERLTSRVQDDLHEVETALDEAMESALEERMEFLEAAYAEAGTKEEKLDALIDGMMEDYRTLARASVDELYGDFAGEMQRLDDFFRRLQRDDNLTEREALEKEMLQAWVALVDRYRDRLEVR